MREVSLLASMCLASLCTADAEAQTAVESPSAHLSIN
jgi:hypothetical protein